MRNPVMLGQKARGYGRWINVALSVAVILLIVLNCSGLRFPILNPRADLDDELARYGAHLPASAIVQRSERVAYRDPEHCFQVNMPPAETIALFASLVKAAKPEHVRLHESHERLPKPAYPKPSWWMPEQFADANGIEVFDEIGRMSAVYSPSTGQALFCWGRY